MDFALYIIVKYYY